MRTTTTALLMGLCSTLLWSQTRSPIPQVRHASESLPPEKLSTTLAEGQVRQHFSNPNASPAPAVCEWVGILAPGAYQIAVTGTERWAPPVIVEKKGRTRCFVGASMKNLAALRIETMPIPSQGVWDLTFQQSLCPAPLQDARRFEIVRVPPPPAEELVCLVRFPEQMPIFAGCDNLPDYESRKSCSDKKMLEFVYRNFHFPKVLKDWCGGSIMVVSFTVDKTGQVWDIKIIRGLHPLLDSELYRVIGSMPVFTPAKHAGKPVGSTYNLPIRFCLE